MIIEAIAAGIIIADWAYHRLTEPDGVKPEKRRFMIPRVDNGAPVGLIYGRVRVREPIVTWTGPVYYNEGGGFSHGYQIDQFFTLGLPFAGGTNVTHGMWVGDERIGWGLLAGGALDDSTQTGDGNFEGAIRVEGSDIGGYAVHGTVETLNGKTTQTLVDDAGVATTSTGFYMLASGLPAEGIPGYRGLMTACLLRDSNSDHFSLGPNASIPAISFEASSYKSYSWLQHSGHHKIYDEANPITVLYSLLTDYLGKGGIATTLIHEASWAAAAATLVSENHGYSNCITAQRPLAEHVLDVLRQIDAVIYEDPSDGLLHIKLIRPDYNASSLPELNKNNAIDLVNFVMGGQQGRTNRVRVLYQSRDHDYNERDAVAFNMANAAGQSGIVNESVLSFEGIKTYGSALRVAHRELAWSCRPLIKFRAIVDRSWYYATPGMAIRVKWTDPDVANLVMRIGRVDRGTLTDGKIGLDLIHDNSYIPPRIPHAEPLGPLKEKP